MEENSSYTVLMSVYVKEKAEYLILSIESMLNQTVLPDEFIIIKDGPLTEELDDIIEKYVNENPGLFKVISNKCNLGLGPALAIGIEVSKNELIARMDSDDYSVNDRCEKQLQKFHEEPELEMVGTFEVEFIGDTQNVISIHRVPENHNEIKLFMRRRCGLLHPTVMYRKSAVIRSGNYQSVLLYEDYDLFARMIFEYGVKSYNIQENLYYIRIGEDFFERRGGLKYSKTVLLFKIKQFKKGYMSFVDLLVSGFGQALICIMPNIIRKWFYITFLR